MYFLAEEEKRWVLRKLSPQAREQGVAEELRGWNWDRPPLSPIFEVRLGMWEVAGQYCPTARDLYLRRVLGVRVPPSPPMVEGGYLHTLLGRIILQAKQALYRAEGQPLEALERLEPPELSPDEPSSAPGVDKAALEERGRLLWRHVRRQIISRVEEVCLRQPYIGVDSLVALALPVVVEQKLNGTFLGLSPHLSADAIVFSEPMVLDIKFGRRQDFHRLTTTGYGLVMESIYEYPVNLGCVVYPTFGRGRLSVERDFHIIDDELRQWFIEARDERMRIVEEEIDPGFPEACPSTCQYYRECRGE